MKISKNKLNVALARKQWNQRDLRDNAVVSSQTILNINLSLIHISEPTRP